MLTSESDHVLDTADFDGAMYTEYLSPAMLLT